MKNYAHFFFLLYIDIEKKKTLVWFVERFVLVFWFYFMVFIQKYFSFSWQLCLCWVRIYCEHFSVLCFVNDIFSGVKSLNRILPFVTGTNKCGIVFIYLLIFVWYDEPKCIQFTSWLFVKLQTHNKYYRGYTTSVHFCKIVGDFMREIEKKPWRLVCASKIANLDWLQSHPIDEKPFKSAHLIHAPISMRVVMYFEFKFSNHLHSISC